MGPRCGIFDQRAAERLNHRADTYGFDAISVGGVLSWLMECLAKGLLTRDELGVTHAPVFSPQGFSLETDSAANAELGVELLDAMVAKRGVLNLEEGARKLARRLACITMGEKPCRNSAPSPTAASAWIARGFRI